MAPWLADLQLLLLFPVLLRAQQSKMGTGVFLGVLVGGCWGTREEISFLNIIMRGPAALVSALTKGSRGRFLSVQSFSFFRVRSPRTQRLQRGAVAEASSSFRWDPWSSDGKLMEDLCKGLSNLHYLFFYAEKLCITPLRICPGLGLGTSLKSPPAPRFLAANPNCHFTSPVVQQKGDKDIYIYIKKYLWLLCFLFFCRTTAPILC